MYRSREVYGTMLELTLAAALAIAGIIIALPRQTGRTPRVLVIVVWLLPFGSLAPPIGRALLEGAFVVLALGVWGRQGFPRRHVIVIALVIVGFWGLLALHPNVPSVGVGIEGARKSTYCLFGLILGASAANANYAASLSRHVVASLGTVLAISLFVHLFVPAVEQSVSRRAGYDSAMFADQDRLQGVLAGPFHAAMAASILLCWAFIYWRERTVLAMFAMALGASVLYLTYVRTALIAAALGLVVGAVLGNRGLARPVRVCIVIMGMSLAGFLAWRFAPGADLMLSSLLNASSDSRFTNRFEGYGAAWSMVQESPFIGWGAGSAGDALEMYFPPGSHVTSHNVWFKFAVEAGVFGLGLWLSVVALVWAEGKWRSAEGRLGAASVVVLATFGLTGSAVEALPISVFVLIFAGLAMNRDDDALAEKSSVGNRRRANFYKARAGGQSKP